MTEKETPNPDELDALLRRIGRAPKTGEQRLADQDRQGREAAVMDLPIDQWPAFKPQWDLSLASQKYVLDNGKDEFNTRYPNGLVLKWVDLADLDRVLDPNSLRRADEVWGVGDDSKAAGVLANWIAGRALTPPAISCFESRMLPLIGGNHRLAVARATGVERLPVLIDPKVFAEVSALLPLSDHESEEPIEQTPSHEAADRDTPPGEA
jgi:hypothetical protein